MKRKAVLAQVQTPQTPTKVRITQAFKASKGRERLTKKCQDPKTPRQIRFNSAYSPLKSLFSSSASSASLCGRNAEYLQLNRFLRTCIEGHKGGCLYISGPPGTGKTALTVQTLKEITQDYSVLTTSVNCFAVGDAKSVFDKVLGGLTDEEDLQYADSFEALKKLGKSSGKDIVIVLDEIDGLAARAQDVVYTLFELPKLSKSRITVIGIANALDLTDRVLPRLKAKSISPNLIYFKPYTATEIVDIIQHRMKSISSDASDSNSLFQPAALQLCAKKVAAQTGDVRKAFDICRRALELAEEEALKRDLKDKTPLEEMAANLATPSRRVSKASTSTNSPLRTVTIAHIARVSAAAFGGSTASRLNGLSIHQKAALCAICVMEKAKTTAFGVSRKDLFQTYDELCQRDEMLGAVSWSEFQDIIGILDDIGLISTSKRALKTNSDVRIASNVSKMDLLVAVSSIGILNRFLISA